MYNFHFYHIMVNRKKSHKSMIITKKEDVNDMEIQSRYSKAIKKPFTGSDLKLIAIIAMLIDHIATTIVWPLYLNSTVVNGVHMMGDLLPEKAQKIHLIFMIMRSIGRLTYPIFAFMLVEGFLHTRNLKKYSFRLLIFAIISEVPYNLANSRSIIDLGSRNIIWSLLIGLIMLYFIQNAEKYDKKKRILLTMGYILMAEAITLLIQANAIGGILLIAFLYIFRNKPKWLFISGTIALCIMALNFMWIQMFGLATFVLFRYYDGTVGKGNKYLFYIFYPAHLLILGIISMIIFTP